MNRRTFVYLGLGLSMAIVAAGIGLSATHAAAPTPPAARAGRPGALGAAATAPQLAPRAPGAPDVVLYDQYDHPGINSTNSQRYEMDFNSYDDFGGDDFTVPAGHTWLVDEIDVAGMYYNGSGPAVDFNVFFFTNSGSLPDAVVYEAYYQSYTGGPTDFVIHLANPAYLTGGSTYWLSVQADMNFNPAGNWGWTNRTVLSGYPAGWINPRGGFGSGCTTWGVRTQCVGAANAPDQVFRMAGTDAIPNTPTATPTPLAGTPTPAPTCVPAGTPGPWATVAPYPQGIEHYAFAQNGADLYVISGVSGFHDVFTARRYNTTTGVWTDLPPIPEGGEGVAGVYYNGNIYVAPPFNSVNFFIYDVALNTWYNGANYPGDGGGEAIGAWNGKIYVVGGYYNENTTWIYDIASDSWAAGPAAPDGYRLGGYQQAGQYLYLVGSDLRYTDENSTTTMRLDMASATYSLGPVWTMQRSDFGLAYDPVGNQLIALGGDINGSPAFNELDEVDELSLAAWPGGAWVVSPPALPSPRQANQGSFYHDGAIYTVGGLTNGLTFTTDVFTRSQPATCAGTTPTPTVVGTATPTATPPAPTSTPPAPTSTPGAATATGVPASATGTAGPSATAPPSATAVAPTATAEASVSPAPPSATPVASATGAPATATPAATPCGLTFSDVPADYFAYPYITWAVCHGIVSGYADGTFRPEANATRGQIAKMVVLAAGFPLVLPPGAPHFGDVPPSNPFYVPIEVAYAHGVISGYADGTFRWNRPVTRAQITKMTVVAAGLALATPPAPTFGDVPATYWAYSYVETAVAHAIISGYDCGGPGEPCPGRYFRPDHAVTRAQLSKILYQAFAGGTAKP